MTGSEIKAAQIASRAATQTGGAQAPTQGGNQSFNKVLEAHENSFDQVRADVMQAMGAGEGVHPANNAVEAQSLHIKPSDVEAAQPAQSTNVAADMLSNLNKNHLRMDEIMKLATSNHRMGNKQLILLQTAMHKLTYEAEVTVKLVDTMKSSIRQVTSTQV